VKNVLKISSPRLEESLEKPDSPTSLSPSAVSLTAPVKAIFRRYCKSITIALIFIVIPLTARAATVTFPGSDPKTIHVEIAKSSSEQARGLMFRESLEADSGMWFVFSDDKPRVFWMKNVRFPIDIIFIDKDMYIRKIIGSARPCLSEPCARYMSGYKVRYVLEAPAGYCESNAVEEKQRVIFRP